MKRGVRMGENENTFLQTNNSMIFYKYQQCEKPNAETILLVHGMGLDLTTWDEVVEDFSANYHILRYDLPGNGRSKLINRDSFGWELLIEDLKCLLEHLHISKVHFIGHSGAGNFGVELAFRYRDYLASLILISTPLFVPSGFTENEIENRSNWNDPAIFNEKILYLAKNICYPEEEEKIKRIVSIYKQTSIDTYLAYFYLYSQAIFNYKKEDLAELTLPILCS